MFFYLTVWFQRERFEAVMFVNIMELIFFHGAGGEGHESRAGGRAMVIGSWW
jgi:hypothetical protein